MEPIQTSLKRWIQENKDFESRYKAMKRDTLAHPDIRQFLEAHPEITETEINKRLNRLYEYTTQSIQCENCTGYQSCKNMLKGYSPILQVVQGEIHLAYEKCHFHQQFERQSEKQNLMKSLYIPREIMGARIDDIKSGPDRAQALQEVTVFLDKAMTKLPEKGIFFTGPFGVGKTYLLGAVANRLAQFNISSMLIFMPEFVREMREAINDNKVQEKIDYFKQTDVLMLDDIGAETFSAWFRDEVLGSILQYRMMEKLPVFFTSNYTMDQLETILATTKRGPIEEVKAGRIMERIKQVSKEVQIDGDSLRE